MHLWQLCHLAMVVPVADAYYEANFPERAGHEYGLMLKTAKQLKKNFYFIKSKYESVSPKKMNMFLYMPVSIIAIVMSFVFKSSFGNKFMYKHAMKAPDEMTSLHRQFYAYINAL